MSLVCSQRIDLLSFIFTSIVFVNYRLIKRLLLKIQNEGVVDLVDTNLLRFTINSWYILNDIRVDVVMLIRDEIYLFTLFRMKYIYLNLIKKCIDSDLYTSPVT